MQTYWDLTEKQRANISDEDLDRLVSIALMEAGVLSVRPLIPEQEPPGPAPTELCYRIVAQGYEHPNVVFRTMEQALAFIDLQPLLLGSKWLGGGSAEYMKPLAGMEVATTRTLSETQIVDSSGVIARRQSVRERNEKDRKEWEEDRAKQVEVTERIYTDRYACQRKAARMQKIADTLSEYRQLAGDDTLARKFLEKAFNGAELADFDAWFAPVDATAKPPPPAMPASSPATARNPDEIPF